MNAFTNIARRHVSRTGATIPFSLRKQFAPTTTFRCYARDVNETPHEHYLPRILQPSTWLNVIPRSLRPSWTPRDPSLPPKPWNPATWFLVMFLFIGSEAIQIISLRHDRADFVRRSDAKIGLLKEVVEKVQSGEWRADGKEVGRALRSYEDREWEDVLKEIEGEDVKWQEEARKERIESRSEGAVGINMEREERPVPRKPGHGTQIY